MTTAVIMNQEGRQEVYLALRNIFKDQHVQLRKRKRIRSLIQIQPQERDLQQILHKYGLDVVVSTARVLLADGIFESDVKAQSLFPDVFKLLRQEKADERVSDTATLDTDHKTNLPPDERRPGDITWSDGCEGKGRGTSTFRHDAHSLDPPPFVCSLGPQHDLMTQIQKAMEYMCFAFAEREMPKVLIAQNWTCPQAVELSRWVEEFSTRPELFGGNQPSKELLQSVECIRHIAVHRKPLTTQELQQRVADATTLATLLAVPQYGELFASLLGTLRSDAKESKGRHRLRVQLEARVADISRRRLELDREECEVTLKLKELNIGEATLADDRVSTMLHQLTSDFLAIAKLRLQRERTKNENDVDDDMDSDADLDFC
ncbi:hypothetical protein Purlil1_13767 [Purpureocillium lilacinum]|uniref:Ubiquinol-cytochrome-c reductase cytochrome c1 n=1 Tax=Purpureocillium lilacinum TaxID=33203 RepID=A0ABR0BD90_PURLI|nr:hypothetical protein Purlil1_13767 [Purpureocillium lilacinum]